MSHLYGIPSLKRKNKPKGVKTEYARGGKVGRNSEGLKKYHACCRENSCAKGKKKKQESKMDINTFYGKKKPAPAPAKKGGETFYKPPQFELLKEFQEVYDNEFEGYLEANQGDNMSEKQQVKLMDKASAHAFRFVGKAYNKTKKRKFKTRKEFIDAVITEARN